MPGKLLHYINIAVFVPARKGHLSADRSARHGNPDGRAATRCLPIIATPMASGDRASAIGARCDVRAPLKKSIFFFAKYLAPPISCPTLRLPTGSAHQSTNEYGTG